MCVCVHAHALSSLLPHGLQAARLLCPWNFLGKNTGVGCHCLLQEIFLTQGSNLSLPHYRQSLYHLRHQGGPNTNSREERCFWPASNWGPFLCKVSLITLDVVGGGVRSCPTLCNLMDSSMPGITVFIISQSLLKLMSVESMMPSNHLASVILHSSPAFNLSQSQGLF